MQASIKERVDTTDAGLGELRQRLEGQGQQVEAIDAGLGRLRQQVEGQGQQAAAVGASVGELRQQLQGQGEVADHRDAEIRVRLSIAALGCYIEPMSGIGCGRSHKGRGRFVITGVQIRV